MKSRLSKADLYRLVHKGRKGDRHALAEFADTVYWTLREPAFDAFQREHGVRAISYREWFYYKLLQFFEILLFREILIAEGLGFRSVEPDKAWEEGSTVVDGRGPVVQLDELQGALGPERNDCRLWLNLARTVSETSDDRLHAAQEWLKSRRAPEPSGVQRRGWTKNQERDQIILNCLGRGMEPESICQELDRRTIPTLPAWQAKRIQRWIEAWADPGRRKALQQLLSKIPQRRKAVKPLAVSE